MKLVQLFPSPNVLGWLLGQTFWEAPAKKKQWDIDGIVVNTLRQSNIAMGNSLYLSMAFFWANQRVVNGGFSSAVRPWMDIPACGRAIKKKKKHEDLTNNVMVVRTRDGIIEYKWEMVEYIYI